jgi:hypothetical protein
MLAKDKHSTLLQTLVNYGLKKIYKSFITLGPKVNAINLFYPSLMLKLNL